MLRPEEVSSLIERYLVGVDSALAWLREIVKVHWFLPLYVGWTAVLGLRPDGSLVRWNIENGDTVPEPLTSPFWSRMALYQGAKLYPEISALLPARPVGARNCAACDGTGAIAGAPEIVCECGGSGWVVEGESRLDPPG